LAGKSAVRAIAGQIETTFCASDIQSVAVSGDGSSDPSLSSEEEDMLLETEVEDGAGLSELATITAGPSSAHPYKRKRKPEEGASWDSYPPDCLRCIFTLIMVLPLLIQCITSGHHTW